MEKVSIDDLQKINGDLLLENKILQERVNYLESAILRGTVNIPADIISSERVRITRLSINDVEFSVRLRNCLKIPGIKTIGELMNWSPKQLCKIRGFGEVCLIEVELFFQKFNLKSKQDD